MIIVLRIVYLAVAFAYWTSTPPIVHITNQSHFSMYNLGWACHVQPVEQSDVFEKKEVTLFDHYTISDKFILRHGSYVIFANATHPAISIIHVQCDPLPMPSWLSTLSTGLFFMDVIRELEMIPNAEFLSYMTMGLIAYKLFHFVFCF